MPGRVSLTMDPWTSVAQDGYMAITVHWITVDFQLRRILLDFVDLPAEHTGENLKNSVMEVLREFGIAHKTLGYTVDGAANMGLFFRVLLPELRMEREKHGVKTDGKLYTVTQHVLLGDFLVFTGVFCSSFRI